MSLPTISVIIPTLEAEKTIEQLITALKRQSIVPLEIIVIDSNSQDRTASIATALGAKVIVIDKAAFNHGLTRNYGAEKALGDILVFMTQDALPADGKTIFNLTRPIIQRRVVAAYARQSPFSNTDPIEKFWRCNNYPDSPVIKNKERATTRRYFFSNVCSAFDKSVFLGVGGFQEVDIGEDMLMAYRLINAGYSIAYQSSAVVYHSHHYTTRQKFKRYYAIGAFNQVHPFLTKEASHEKEGISTVKKLLSNLINNRKYWYVLIAVWDMGIRYIAYAAGRLSISFANNRMLQSQGRLVKR